MPLPPAPSPHEAKAEEARGGPDLDLVGPLDLRPPGGLAGGHDLRAPTADLESLLGMGAEHALSQTPGLALECPSGLALDHEPALDREQAIEHDPVRTGLTPFTEDGGAGGPESLRADPAPVPSRRPTESGHPVPTAAAAAAAVKSVGPQRPFADQAPAPVEAKRPKASLPAAALSLAFLVAAAAITFVVWRGSMGAHTRQAATSGIEAEEVAAGPYDTAAGTTVLVVRGRVTARERVVGPVRVEAQLWGRGGLVATAEGRAGASASPEEVYASGTIGDAEALRKALDGRAAKGLEAGESAPFLLVFPPPAPEMRGRELRVVASPATGAN